MSDFEKLINASDLIEWIMETYPDWCEGAVRGIVDHIDEMPSAQERKTGRWIELTNTNHTYVCSVCGRMLVNITDGKNSVYKHYPYCHCGCKMGVEHDT